MSTSSQTPDTSEVSNQSKTTSSTPAVKSANAEVTRTTVCKERLDSDLSILQSGAYADFTVVCGKEQWKTHRFVLSRCPYFKPIVSEDSAFKETQESCITIEGFEPFEIGWLLEYIYSLRLDFEQAKASSPNKSYLETCVLIWSLGDYFSLPELCLMATSGVVERCRKLNVVSRCVSVVSHEISFLPGLEAGIRAAWRTDRVAAPARKQLMNLCCGLYPFLRDQPSFLSLLDELPEFTIHFVKALLGCPGLQLSMTHNMKQRCYKCNAIVWDKERGKGNEFVEDAFITMPNSLEIQKLDASRVFYCSRDCYNSTRQAENKFTEDLPKEG